MAQADIGSRRKCEAIISSGRVQVNGKVIGLGAKADPFKDVILVDGVRISTAFESNLHRGQQTQRRTHLKTRPSRTTTARPYATWSRFRGTSSP